MRSVRYVVRMALCAGAVSLAAANGAAAERQATINGELVIVDRAAKRFRLVGHDGTYVAPPGASLEALDGKDVTVQIGAQGQVTQIAPVTVPITPITQSLETIRGTLQVKDAAARTFSIHGFDTVHTAPAGTDVSALKGKWVEVRIGRRGEVISIVATKQP